MPQDARQHTSATQPIPVGDSFVPQQMEMPIYGYPFINEGRIFTPFWDEPIPIRPSSYGGTTWAPSAYDPRTNTLYICGIDVVGLFVGGAEDPVDSKEMITGGQFLLDSARTGIFAAVDVTTNKLRWRHRWQDICYSGVTATAGDVIFSGQNDGRFVALDSRDGKLLWEFQTGAGVNAPPVVFEHLGVEYVAVYAAGALLAQSPPGDNVWLFSLNGTLDEVAPNSSVQETVLTNTQAQDSAAIYARHCAQCHGESGQGGQGGGPKLRASSEFSKVQSMIASGNDRMPGFGDVLTFEQLQSVARYVSAGIAAP